jgi:hypothetical protein
LDPIDRDRYPRAINTDTRSLEEFEKATREAEEVLKKWTKGSFQLFTGKKAHWNYIPRVERGFHNLELFGTISISGCLELPPGRPKTIHIKWDTVLGEDDPANADEDIETVDYSNCIGDSGFWGPEHSMMFANYIQKGTEQMRGVLKWFSSHESDQRHLLDRGSTNLLEPLGPGEECQYCWGTHTNDCLLPWSLDNPIKSHPQTPERFIRLFLICRFFFFFHFFFQSSD